MVRRVYRYGHIVIPRAMEQVGAIVRTGQLIASMSDLGSRNNVHLHFEVFPTRAAHDRRQQMNPRELFPNIVP
jgi:murein DD-endopeptidase MepM/ murein hydrolase activator NlpD